MENDYVLVFFSSPAKYRPPWMWLLRAYRALDRKYVDVKDVLYHSLTCHSIVKIQKESQGLICRPFDTHLPVDF